MYMAHFERKTASTNLAVPRSMARFAYSLFISNCTHIQKFSNGVSI